MIARPSPKARKEPWSLNASQVVLLAFITAIALGAILLALPISHTSAPHNWIDDLFVATSAVCVTGLTPLDVGTSYSLFGQVVIMLLFQLGGLGYMALFTVSMLLVGKRLSMRDRLNMQQATEQPGMQGLINFGVGILTFTLVVEAVGFFLLSFSTVPEFGWGSGLYLALFHALSAFNNAGFSLLPDGAMHWQRQEGTLLVLAALVLIGSLGYTVNHQLVKRYFWRDREPSRWDTLVKLVLVLSAVLVVATTALIWLFERHNPATLAELPWHSQFVNSLFMAIMPRSGGLHSLDVAAYDRPTQMVTMVLMFVGGGPGGTAGGIKLTTVAIVLAALMAAVRGQDDVTLFGLKRRVGEKIVRKAYTVLALTMVQLVVVVILLAALEPLPLMPLLFEASSATGVVGLSLGATPTLSDPSKLLLVVCMIAGRLGMLTVLLALFPTRKRSSIRYAEEPLLVG